MRVIFLIDGFNLYHSISDAQKDSGLGSKWLNIHSLMSSYLEHLSNDAFIENIYFFTAIRTHVQKFNPDTVKRHKNYLNLLKETSIEVVEGKFKKGDNLIFAAFGGGFTWGAIYLKWAYTK